MDIKSGGNAILYKYKGSLNEKFDIGRTGSGTYNIKNNGKYVSVSNGNVQTMISYPSGTWCFERVYRGEINMFSFKYADGLDTTIQNDNIIVNFKHMNYQYWGSYVNTSCGYGFQQMQTSHIWIFQGHGGPCEMVFTTDGKNHKSLTTTDINLLDWNSFSTERVIIASGCNTGNDLGSRPTYSGNNLIEAMYEKGAHFAIGWKGNIQNGKAARWVTLFFDYSSRGKSVYDAMKYADKESYAGPTYYAGDTFQILTR